MGGGSVSAPTPTPLGTQFLQLTKGIQQAAPNMVALDQSVNGQYATANQQAQARAAALWGQSMQTNLLPQSATNTNFLENQANQYTAQNAPGVMQTYMQNNPALMAALSGSIGMSGGTGGGTFSLGGGNSGFSGGSSSIWQPGTDAVAGQAATTGFGTASALPGAGANQQAISQWWAANQGKTVSVDNTLGSTQQTQQSISGNAPNPGNWANYLNNFGWQTGGGKAAVAGTPGTAGHWVTSPGSSTGGGSGTPTTFGNGSSIAPSQSLMSLMGSGNELNNYGLQLAQGSPLLQQQNRQAQQELATNGKLSPQEMSTIQQQVAGQFASSGLGGSSANIADQALSLEQGQNARLMQYQANAQAVQGENTQNAGAAESAMNFAGSIYGTAGGLQNQANSNLFSLASLMQSPIAGLQNSYLGAMNNYGTQAMQGGINTPMNSQQINPQMISVMQDFYNTQYNAQAAANNANAAGQSAQSGAMVAGGASIAAAGITAVAIF